MRSSKPSSYTKSSTQPSYKYALLLFRTISLSTHTTSANARRSPSTTTPISLQRPTTTTHPSPTNASVHAAPSSARAYGPWYDAPAATESLRRRAAANASVPTPDAYTRPGACSCSWGAGLAEGSYASAATHPGSDRALARERQEGDYGSGMSFRVPLGLDTHSHSVASEVLGRRCIDR